MSMLRQDPVSGGWVIISEERGMRPIELTSPEVDRGNPANCPFCEGKESLTTPEIRAYRHEGTTANGPGWFVRTIANKFAALNIEGNLERHAEGIYDAMNGVGAHEVVIETTDHMAHMGDYSTDHMTSLLWMYRERVEDLYRDPRFRYIQVFKNYGMSAGASQAHPHSQIIALPITPRWVKEELVRSKQHYQMKERCIFCDIIGQERYSAERLVFENEEFISFCPYASKFPFETWILPKRHDSEFRHVRDEEIPKLADALQKTLKALHLALNDPPFNFIMHSAPRISPERYPQWTVSIDRDYHWHIEIIPRTTQIAGFEWGTGFYINPTLPEKAAGYLRGILNGD